MPQEHRTRSRERLARTLTTPQYTALLHTLQERYPVYRRFDTWTAVVAFMQDDPDDETSDTVLRPVYRALQQGGDSRWHTVLLAIFWPQIGRAHV